MTEVTQTAGTAGSGGGNLEVGHLFNRALATFKTNPGLYVGAFVVYSIIANVGSSFSQGGEGSGIVIGLSLSGLLAGPMIVGYSSLLLKGVRSANPSFGDLFSGFSKFLTSVGFYILFGLIVVLGMALLVVPGVIAGLGLGMGIFLIMDRDLGAIDALKGSWKLTAGVKGALFLVFLVAGLVVMAGFVALCVGVLVAGPLAALMIAAAYDELSDRPHA